MHTFTKLYLAAGAGLLAIFGLLEVSGGLVPRFGTGGNLDTSSRQGYWYTYRRQSYSAGPGRSPGGSGGSYGGGGYSGGK
jgi:hypothetical protein